MQSLKQNKILLALFIIALVAFLIYQFGGASTPVEDPLFSDQTVEDSIAQDVLVLLNKMQQARIDSDLFTATSWTTLVDYSISLPDDIPGRPELFTGPLRGNASVATSTPLITPSVQR